MRLRFFLLTMLLALPAALHAQTNTSESKKPPRLVVGIVVDQMRYDYLTRFDSHYGEGGFKRLIREGFAFENNHFNYIPTYTGPGHASVYTGTYPAIHGVVANDWYDKESKEKVYCVSDNQVEAVGTSHKAGQMSPHRLKTTTVLDQLRLHTQQGATCIAVSIKDRGAVLPGGHNATAAYWFHGKNEGKWISSTHYMKTLPDWVNNFNDSGLVASYMQEWDTFYPIETYRESSADENAFEKPFKGKETATFPYDLKTLASENGQYDILKETPYGNNLTTDFAIAALEGERMGKDTITDFLAISYSSPDYIGHQFGVHSKEVQDNYIRLDQDIEKLLTYLDANVGVGQYTIMLTADHGAVHNPGYLQEQKIPAGYFSSTALEKELQDFLKQNYGTDTLLENLSGNQLFLNKKALQNNQLSPVEVQQTLAAFLLEKEQVDKVFTRAQLENTSYTKDIGYLVQNGFHQKRSGDVVFVLDPAVISTWYETGGSTHGSGFTYDTHVPLLFYGNGIPQGKTYNKSEITDIAPTLSALLGIARPNGATGRVLTELWD